LGTKRLAQVLVVSLSLLLPPAVAAQDGALTLTLLEGQATLLRGTRGYVPAEGVRLRDADILHTGKNGFVQLEFDDGAALELGAETRVLTSLPGWRGQPPAIGPQYQIAGWIKLSVPSRKGGTPYRVNTPHLDLLVGAGVGVLQIGAAEASLFMESGEGAVLEPTGRAVARTTVPSGRFYVRKAGQRGVVVERPTKAFLESMPRVFRDTLPLRLAKFKGRDVSPRPGPDFSYADVADWLKSDPAVRRALVPLWRPKADDPDFRAGLVANMRFHWEWDPIVFPEKYKPKEEPETSETPTAQADQQDRK